MLNSTWDKDPAGYDSHRTTWLHQRKTNRLFEFLTEAKAGERIIEVGCGTGVAILDIAERRPDLSFIGIDPNREYIDYANTKVTQRKFKNVSFSTGLAEQISSSNENSCQANWIISTDVLHHVSDLRRSIEEISLNSCSGAKWMILEPSWLNPYICYFQATKLGERNFWPNAFLELTRNNWHHEATQYINIIPSAIKKPNNIIKKLEYFLEGLPVICGTICLVLQKK
ncbi:class I SAM-dependent methyltransferase [Paucibacter sp. B2R-40]|uniref:class I SAM-dependent methyltransferase n=1 Tax=Paucibacter sp. B2R-40 TaxID=2893554 RepID=UPI0021E40144|nr:class I SAM-dependent methyltransferase [Paucibacter sp. B2R-40]MCV2353664.1 class I SAM-dependent methyltransferase [Paucibacter sp. B2R-40]